MSIDIQKLKALAEAATQGEWTCGERPDGRFWHIGCGNQAIGAAHSASKKHNPEYAAMFEANAKYIAAANPAAVLELIAEIERSRTEIAGHIAAHIRNYSEFAEQRDRLKAEKEAVCALLKLFVDSEHDQDEDQNERHHYHGEAELLLSKLGGEYADYALVPEQALSAQTQKIEALRKENERLQRFETAYKEFSDKTDWVRPNAATHELGMHVADILRKRCDDLTSHNQAQADEIKALRAASTPQHAGHIPGGAIADDVTGRRVIVSGDAINRLKASHPRACVNAGLCEKVGQRLYTRVFTELSACGTGGRP
jgi:hypothetical protein